MLSLHWENVFRVFKFDNLRWGLTKEWGRSTATITSRFGVYLVLTLISGVLVNNSGAVRGLPSAKTVPEYHFPPKEIA